MGTLYNEDNTGNQTVGTIGTRTIAQIQKNVLPFNYTTSSSITASLNNQYVIQNGGGWTLTMPSGAQAGDRVRITTNFAGGTIQFPAANYVIVGNRSTTLGGTVSTIDEGAVISFVCDFNTGQVEWSVEEVTGNWLGSGSPTNFDINSVFDYTNDGSGNISADFKNRKLYLPNGNVAVDFSTNGIIDLSPLSSPQQNLVKINQLSVYTAFQAPAGIVTLTGTNTNVTATGTSSSSLVFLQPLGAAPVGRLWATPSTDNVSINSTLSESSLSVAYWVIGQHS